MGGLPNRVQDAKLCHTIIHHGAASKYGLVWHILGAARLPTLFRERFGLTKVHFVDKIEFYLRRKLFCRHRSILYTNMNLV